MASSLDQQLECSVCLDMFTDPHTLQCLHTFCLTCLQGLNRAGKLNCPECRNVSDFKTIKKDFRLQGIIETCKGKHENPAAKASETGRDNTKCDVCKDAQKAVTARCMICDEYLCEHCATAHQGSKLTKDHLIQPRNKIIKKYQAEIDKAVTKCKSEIETMGNIIFELSKCRAKIKEQCLNQKADITKCINNTIQQLKMHERQMIENTSVSNNLAIKSLEVDQKIVLRYAQQLNDQIDEMEQWKHSDNLCTLDGFVTDINDNLETRCKDIRSVISQINTDVNSPVRVITGEVTDPFNAVHVENYSQPIPVKRLDKSINQ